MNNVVDANLNTVVNVKIENVLKAISDLKIGKLIPRTAEIALLFFHLLLHPAHKFQGIGL